MLDIELDNLHHILEHVVLDVIINGSVSPETGHGVDL